MRTRSNHHSARPIATIQATTKPMSSANCSGVCRAVDATPGREPIQRAGSAIHCIQMPSTSTQHSSASRSEEHTSELQSQSNLVCRLLLEKKKKKKKYRPLKETTVKHENKHEHADGQH